MTCKTSQLRGGHALGLASDGIGPATSTLCQDACRSRAVTFLAGW